MISRRAVQFRILASGLSCLAYILLTSGYLVPGAFLNLTCQFLWLPYALQHKSYDLMVLSAFFAAVNLKILVPALLRVLY
jgi:hypothetical protein